MTAIPKLFKAIITEQDFQSQMSLIDVLHIHYIIPSDIEQFECHQLCFNILNSACSCV